MKDQFGKHVLVNPSENHLSVKLGLAFVLRLSFRLGLGHCFCLLEEQTGNFSSHTVVVRETLNSTTQYGLGTSKPDKQGMCITCA